MATRSELEAAYTATTYRVFFPAAIGDLRLAQASEILRCVLQSSGALTFVILTAYNPCSLRLDTSSNQVRHRAMKADLLEISKHVFDGENLADNKDWPVEKSCCILGMSLIDACLLGNKYGQNAIVYGGEDAIPHLYWIKETE